MTDHEAAWATVAFARGVDSAALDIIEAAEPHRMRHAPGADLAFVLERAAYLIRQGRDSLTPTPPSASQGPR